jgi:TonB family protein
MRRKVTSLSSIRLGEAGGGFVLDVSEGGLCFQPIAPLQDADLRWTLRFQLPYSPDWIESGGRKIWTRGEGESAGLQFVDLSESARARIRDWISGQELDEDSASRPEERAAAGFSAELGALPPVLGQIHDGSAAASEGVAVPEIPNVATVVSALPQPSHAISSPAVLSPATVQEALPTPKDERGAADSVQVVVQLRSRWTLPALISVLVVLSFALGVAVGHGSLDRWLGAPAEELAQNKSETGSSSQAASTPAPADAGSSPPTLNQTPSQAKVPRPSNGDVSISNSSKSASQPWPHGDADGAEPTDQATTFTQPERSVSASATVAITSLRSVVLNGRTGATPGPGFHCGPLVNHTDPSYPPQAIDQGVEGTVELRVNVARDGSVVDVEPISGPNVLLAPAISAVRIWRYQPTYLGGHAVESSDTLRVTFRLAR